MKKRASVHLLCVCCVLLACLLTGCARSSRPAGDEQGRMNIDFTEGGMLRNGTAYNTYQVEAGQRGVISLRIDRKAGRIDVDVYPAIRRDAPAYTGRDLDTAAFDVILSEPGEYKVVITAADFVGDYGITWRTEDAAD